MLDLNIIHKQIIKMSNAIKEIKEIVNSFEELSEGAYNKEAHSRDVALTEINNICSTFGLIEEDN